MPQCACQHTHHSTHVQHVCTACTLTFTAWQPNNLTPGMEQVCALVSVDGHLSARTLEEVGGSELNIEHVHCAPLLILSKVLQQLVK